jgi:hypothetical protein
MEGHSDLMTTKCLQQGFPCRDISYSDFDSICSQELAESINADQILNQSPFCVNIPINDSLKFEDLETSDYLKILKGKMGLYHLWIDYDECDDHNMNTLLCIYVGKGLAGGRIKNHVNEKYQDLGGLDTLFCTFYECTNRIAKYLEQLFLDLYKLESNSYENNGLNHLFGVWTRERYLHGTELGSLANIYSSRQTQS